MVSGTLSVKKGYYYAVLSWVDVNGKRHRKWISIGLPEKGNKRRAQAELARIRSEFEPPTVDQELCPSMLFSDYLFQWLDVVKVRVKVATFSSYQHGLKKIRFHDLRHSCASLLLSNGVPLKQIQEWLGHSDFSTTANIYAHLDYKSKISSAQAMENGISLPNASEFESRWSKVTDSGE